VAPMTATDPHLARRVGRAISGLLWGLAAFLMCAAIFILPVTGLIWVGWSHTTEPITDGYELPTGSGASMDGEVP